jgi:hypothetical protein
MNKSGYNIPLLLYSAVKKHIPAWTKKLEKRMPLLITHGIQRKLVIIKKEQIKFALKSKTDGHH